MEDDIYSLTVKCVGHVLIHRVGNVERKLQEEDISKTINLYMAIMCVMVRM